MSRDAARFCETRKVIQGSLNRGRDRNVSGLKGDVSTVSLLDSRPCLFGWCSAAI